MFFFQLKINHISLFLLIRFSSVLPSPASVNADRYLLKVLRRARNRFVQHKHSSSGEPIDIKHISIDNQSDSGIFTSSSRTNFTDDFESNTLLDIDEDDLQSIDTIDPENELLCQSLEAALMKTLLELRQHREMRALNSSTSKYVIADNNDSMMTRL